MGDKSRHLSYFRSANTKVKRGKSYQQICKKGMSAFILRHALLLSIFICIVYLSSFSVSTTSNLLITRLSAEELPTIISKAPGFNTNSFF